MTSSEVLLEWPDSVSFDLAKCTKSGHSEISQGFDEFMKSLGVGLMKRKLANSVTPVNVVEIEDGTPKI